VAGAPAVPTAPRSRWRHWGRRCLDWRGTRWLRFLLIWPLIEVYRGCVRRSLRWRLAESHVGTILLSVLAVSLVGALATVGAAFIQRPMDQEPASEAKLVAKGLENLGWVDDLTLLDQPATRSPTMVAVEEGDIAPPAQIGREAQARTSALLEAMKSGTIGPNAYTQDVNLEAATVLGRQLANIASISVVGPDLTVLASSEPSLIDRSALLISPTALGVADSALQGETSTETNTAIMEGIGSITGSYPLYSSTGSIVGAVVLDKSERTLTSDWAFAALILEYIGELALTIAVLIGLPAIPIGTVIGIRRARAISQPVRELAVAADEIADQRLDARVRVEGEDEIATLGRRFNEMADRLQESLQREAAARARAEKLLAANRELVANVSHELRTPVALVRAHLESLGGEPEHVEEYARIALRETDRLEALVNDLFQLARLEGQGMSLDREPFDAGAAVREATESLIEPARREAGIAMRTDIAADDLTGLGDRSRLVQTLQNLIRNAIRYTPEGGIVLVGARAEGDEILVTVQDTGVGIAPEDLPHVFDRFYRADRSRNRAQGGAGLGLAIVRGLVEAMGGTIAVESEVGEGTRFTIRLPRATAAV